MHNTYIAYANRLRKQSMIFVCIEDYFSSTRRQITFVIWSLATYDRVRIIRKPDNPRVDNREYTVQVLRFAQRVLLKR